MNELFAIFDFSKDGFYWIEELSSETASSYSYVSRVDILEINENAAADLYWWTYRHKYIL